MIISNCNLLKIDKYQNTNIWLQFGVQNNNYRTIIKT